MNKKLKLFIFSLFIFQCTFIFSQQFEAILIDSLQYTDACKWFDYDSDGDLDIIMGVGGWTGLNKSFLVYRNDSGKFIKNTDILIPSETYFGLGDMNNDNCVDVITMGYSQHDYIKVHLNKNSSSWEPFIDFGYFHRGEIEAADFNNDGRTDLLLHGYDIFHPATFIRLNENNYFNTTDISLGTNEDGFATAGDFNNDGYIDVLSSGWASFQNPVIRVAKNFKNEFFTTNYSSTDYATAYGGWADFNNDGYLDFYLLDRIPNYGSSIRYYYENQNGNNFIKRNDLPADSIFISSNVCGDLDNDGLQDILTVSSIINKNFFPKQPVRLALNQGDFNFKNISDSIFKNISYGNLSLGDYNNDGSLDILISGNSFLKLFKNISSVYNNRPEYPRFLKCSVTDNNIVNLSWEPGNDIETDSLGLSYNIYIISESGNFIVSPLADLETGFKRTADRGNAYHSLRKVIKNLPAGKFKWSVQSIDNSYYCSNFAPPDSFNILPTSEFVLPLNGCSKQDIIIKYSGNVSTDSNTKFIWSTDNGIIKQNWYSNEFVVKWDTGGIKNVSLKIIRDGLISNSTSHQINLKNTPDPFFEIPKEICMYDTIEALYTGESEQGTTFSFTFENGSISYGNGKGPHLVYWTYPGWKEVSFSADYKGCVSDSILWVNIMPTPDIDPLCYVSIDTSNIINVFVNDSNINSGEINTIYRINFNGSTKPIFEYNSNFNGFVIDTIFNQESKYYSYYNQTINTYGCISNTNKVKPIILDYVLSGNSWLKLFWETNYDEISEQSIYLAHESKKGLMDNQIGLNNYETAFFDNYTFGVDFYYRIHNELECDCLNSETADVYSNTLKIYFDEDSLKFNLYPNPFHDKLYINSNINFEFAQVNLYDINGILVLNSYVSSNNSIDFSDLSAGVYIIKIFTNMNVYQTKIAKY